MSVSQTEVVDYIKNLRLHEVKGLVEALEDELGVEAAPPLVPVPPPDYREVEVEQTEFDVVLQDWDQPQKVAVIRLVRQETGLGLREAKAVVEQAPTTIREAISKADAEELAAKFEAVGATALVK